MTLLVSRRLLLSLGGGVVAGAALNGLVPSCAKTGASNAPVQGTITARKLVETMPFYIAHRGGGRDWPELTAFAYEQASAVPDLRALEMSVCLSRDGVLVLSHDETTTRMTGYDYVIAETDWADLASLEVTAAETLDPTQPSRPFTRLDDVLERYIDKFVIFIEPKVKAAVDPLFGTLAQVGHGERVVWKQPINSTRFLRAKAEGFMTWGYVLDEPAHVENLTRFARDVSIDMLGVEQGAPDELIEAVAREAAAENKPAIMWPISTAERRDLALRQGYQGIMCSEPRGVLSTPIPT